MTTVKKVHGFILFYFLTLCFKIASSDREKHRTHKHVCKCMRACKHCIVWHVRFWQNSKCEEPSSQKSTSNPLVSDIISGFWIFFVWKNKNRNVKISKRSKYDWLNSIDSNWNFQFEKCLTRNSNIVIVIGDIIRFWQYSSSSMPPGKDYISGMSRIWQRHAPKSTKNLKITKWLPKRRKSQN